MKKARKQKEEEEEEREMERSILTLAFKMPVSSVCANAKKMESRFHVQKIPLPCNLSLRYNYRPY